MKLYEEITELWDSMAAYGTPADEAMRAVVRHLAATVRDWAPGPEAFPIVNRSYNDVADRLIYEMTPQPQETDAQPVD